MMFSSLLPKPKHSDYEPAHFVINRPSTSKVVVLPSQLNSFQKSLTVQNPSHSETSNVLQTVQTNPDGTIDYASTIASATADGVRKVQASYEDTIPLKVRYPNLKHHFPRYTLETCPDDSLKECLDLTKKTIEDIINKKNGIDPEAKASMTKSTYINYKPDSQDEKMIQVRTYQEDPMLPPKFKLRKNRHKEPSPPPPILRKAETKPLTKEEKDKWKIPAAISNWKNNQGFTIALDKRMLAANGGSASNEPTINIEKFGGLTSALENADKQARDEIQVRNELLREQALKKQQENELRIKQLAEAKRGKKRSHDDDYGKRKR